MSTFPTTDAQLIAAIAENGQQEAWYEFESLYRPALIAALRKQGLGQDDVEDCSQRIFAKLIQVAADFESDGQPAAFRRWLYRVARNETISFLRQQNRFPISLSESGWHRQADLGQTKGASHRQPTDSACGFEKSIEVEYRKQAFLAASQQIRANCNPKHWQAFWRTMIEPEPTPIVAKELGMSVGAVYVAKGRILKQLQRAVKDWEQHQ